MARSEKTFNEQRVLTEPFYAVGLRDSGMQHETRVQ
jgi:hypothetical protein